MVVDPVLLTIVAIGVSLGTLLVAVAGLVLTVFNSTRAARVEDIRLLNDRLDTETARHAQCEERLEIINRENISLMRELIAAGIHPSVLAGGGPAGK